MTRDDYVAALKAAAIKAGKQATVDLLVSRFSFLAAPVIGPIFSFLVGKIIEIAITQTEIAIFFQYIDMRTSEQAQEFESAAVENFLTQSSGSPEERALAEAKLIYSFKRLAKLTS